MLSNDPHVSDVFRFNHTKLKCLSLGCGPVSCFALLTMTNAFKGPTYLKHFDFEPYNTVKFGHLDVVQQWNACQGHINELSVQILEMEIYEGPEKNTLEYKKLVWQATNLQFWHKQAATVIQVWMRQCEVTQQQVQL